jgi:hypothetical protein
MLRTVAAWLALASLTLAWAALRALAGGRPIAPYEADAVRHMLALGVVTTLIVTMGYLLLPWMALRRQHQIAARRETWLLRSLLTGATALRVLGALLEGRGVGVVRYWPMAVAGVLALAAIAFFAVTLLRAARLRPIALELRAEPAGRARPGGSRRSPPVG